MKRLLHELFSSDDRSNKRRECTNENKIYMTEVSFQKTWKSTLELTLNFVWYFIFTIENYQIINEIEVTKQFKNSKTKEVEEKKKMRKRRRRGRK